VRASINFARIRGVISVRFLHESLGLLLIAGLAVSTASATRVHHRASSSSRTRTLHKAAPIKSHRLHGQQAIEPARVLEIQQALIREHYLTGEANGSWDATTAAAMQKYQADQGWQTRLMPDSRALKKLGLGPDYSGAINARDSSFGAPPPASTIPPDQAAGFAAASGVNR
jgi:peptidoglycan hydrolase-like protein with peptidoglycan-binding domain